MRRLLSRPRRSGRFPAATGQTSQSRGAPRPPVGPGCSWVWNS